MSSERERERRGGGRLQNVLSPFLSFPVFVTPLSFSPPTSTTTTSLIKCYSCLVRPARESVSSPLRRKGRQVSGKKKKNILEGSRQRGRGREDGERWKMTALRISILRWAAFFNNRIQPQIFSLLPLSPGASLSLCVSTRMG